MNSRGSIFKVSLALCIALASLGLSGCETTDATPLAANISLTFTPDPVVAEESPDAEYEWRAEFTLILVENRGVGGTITSVEHDLQETADGVVVVSDEEVISNVAVESTTETFEGNGTFTIHFTADYTLPGGGREAAFDVTVSILDEHGYPGTGTTRANIT